MGKEFEEELEKGLKSHPMADRKVEINSESQKKLENIDDSLLIGLAATNIESYVLITCREIALQRELRRRKRALPPDFVKEVVDKCYDKTLKDKDLCSVEVFKKWREG